TRHTAGTVGVSRTTARDTLGAGDVLRGAFARAWASGVRDPERSLRFATAVATVRVEHVGPRIWVTDHRLGRLAEDELR
ncbi:MAG: carbohydrate kinase family protein, partial [Actinomycetota bacterium]|nr:carbohydrate kinase family protein [Actinomycetota bacterium]